MLDLIVIACVSIIVVHWMQYVENLDDKKALRKDKWM